MRQGFTLLELSIVLVIIGLIVGGIMTGQSLVRSAELRAVSTEFQRYQTAVVAFKDKYGGLPGDITNGTFFFGKDNTNCSGNTGTATTPGTCNGDGDGIIARASAASATGEMFQFWKQLALAGLIQGTYSGIAGSGSQFHCPIDTACPRSKASNAGWGVLNGNNFAGDGISYAMDYGNYLRFGADTPAGLPGLYTLSPTDAYNIDTKMDDGKPASGMVIAIYWNNACATNNSGTISNTNLDDSYRVTDSSIQCGLYFRKAF